MQLLWNSETIKLKYNENIININSIWNWKEIQDLSNLMSLERKEILAGPQFLE